MSQEVVLSENVEQYMNERMGGDMRVREGYKKHIGIDHCAVSNYNAVHSWRESFEKGRICVK